MPPLEQQMKSQPASFSALAKKIVSSIVVPPSTQSTQERRTPSGLSAGQTSRMARNTCSGKLHTIFDGAAIFIFPPIGERREEGREQITVRTMHLAGIKAGACRAPRRIDESRERTLEILAHHRARRPVIPTKGRSQTERSSASRLCPVSGICRRARAHRTTPCVRRARSECRSSLRRICGMRRGRASSPPHAHRPRAPRAKGVIRPTGSTSVISTTTNPAPEIAKAGRCRVC